MPTVSALKALGGSGTIEEINEQVYTIAKISEDILEISHDKNRLTREVDYRLAWSRTYLKKYGLIDNSSQGVWALTQSDVDPKKIDKDLIVKIMRDSHRKTTDRSIEINDNKTKILEQEALVLYWKEQLLDTVLGITPGAFERLAQRLLRESGFIQVEVTGKTGDGGIDGKGIVSISGC